MKNFKMMMAALMASALFVPGVLADCDLDSDAGAMASITKTDTPTKYCDSVKDAVDTAQSGDTVNLMQPFTFTEVDNTNRIEINNKDITFNFGVNSITAPNLGSDFAAFVVKGTSKVTFEGSGGIEHKKGGSALLIMNTAEVTIKGGNFTQSVTADPENYAAISVDDSATLKVVEGDENPVLITGGIAVFGTSKLEVSKGTIIADDFAISGNGSQTTNSTITITGGTITSNNNAAIYHPQKGTLNITGGNITGKIGIVARGGTIDISANAKIKATGTAEDEIVVGDAKDSEGEVKLPGGIGVIADKTENYPDATSLKIEITGGEFDTEGDAVLAYKDVAEDATDIINVSGGKFNNNVPAKYMKNEEGYGKSESGEVGKIYNIEKITTVNGDFEVNKTAVAGEIVKITTRPNSGYKVALITVMKGDDPVLVTGDSFEMPAGDVKVSVTFVKVEEPTKDEPTDNKPSENETTDKPADDTPTSNPNTYDGIASCLVMAISTLGVVAIVSKKLLDK